MWSVCVRACGNLDMKDCEDFLLKHGQILSGLIFYFSTLPLCEEVKAHSEQAVSRIKNVFTEKPTEKQNKEAHVWVTTRWRLGGSW